MDSIRIPSFAERLSGAFSGIVTWQQLDDLWARVRAQAAGWYIYAVGDVPPAAPAEASALIAFTQEITALLKRDHKEDYCGIVYADDKDDPTFIKIFDPHNLGSSCGSSGVKTLPGWLVTRMPPERLDDPRPLPESRKRWWRSVFAKAGSDARRES